METYTKPYSKKPRKTKRKVNSQRVWSSGSSISTRGLVWRYQWKPYQTSGPTILPLRRRTLLIQRHRIRIVQTC